MHRAGGGAQAPQHPTWAQSQQALGASAAARGGTGTSAAAVAPPAAAADASAAAAAAPGAGASVSGSGWSLEAQYDLVGKIGEGTYGVVYLATAKADRRRVFAVKKFKTGREGDGISPTAIREILLLRELRHEHIVALAAVHVCRAEPSLSLAFEYAEHDLYEIIWHHRDRLAGPIDPYVLKSLMWQLLNGLSYLHQNWIIHRDLKPSNVLVMGEGPEAGVVKVADFGLARFFQAPLRPLSDNGVVVTIWYRPPELLLGGRHYTRAVDMWGAGCIFAELLTLRPLFQGQERKQPGSPFQLDQLDRVFRVLGHPSPRAWPHLEQLPHWASNTENVRVKRPEWGSNRLEAHLGDVLRHLGEAFARAGGGGGGGGGRGAGGAAACAPRLTPAGIDLLQAMLEYDPLRRISAQEALAHPYFHEHPRPGPNAFVCEGRRVASYPRRHKQTVFPPTAAAGSAGAAAASGAAAAAAGGAAAAAAADGAAGRAQPPPQQQQGQQQQQQQPGQRAGQQPQGSAAAAPPRQQQQQAMQRSAAAGGQLQRPGGDLPPGGAKKRKADAQGGRKGDGGGGGGGGGGGRASAGGASSGSRDRYGR